MNNPLADLIKRRIAADGPFSMDTTPVANRVAGWWGTLWSNTIAWLYGPIVALVVAATAVAFWSK